MKRGKNNFSKTHKTFIWILAAFLLVELIFVVDMSITGNPILKTVERGVDVFGEGEEIVCESYQKNIKDSCVTDEKKLEAFRVMPPNPFLLEEIDKGEKDLPEFFYDGRLIEGVQPTKKINFDKLSQDKDGVSQFKILVVLVDFSDKPGQVNPEFFDNLLFGNEGNTVKNYYLENSYGKFELTTLNLPSSLGWIRAPNPYSYYVGGVGGTGVYPHNSQDLAEDMIGILNPLIDFSEYDNDNDGYVDAILFIHSGSGGEFTGNVEDMWSHKWSMFSSLYVDGVHASVYATTPEYWNAPSFEDMTIGVISHELGHAMLLLPDLYDTDGSSLGIGRWDLMASGAWNGENGMGSSPSHFNAWSKIVSGFAEPIIVEDNFIITNLFPSSLYLK